MDAHQAIVNLRARVCGDALRPRSATHDSSPYRAPVYPLYRPISTGAAKENAIQMLSSSDLYLVPNPLVPSTGYLSTGFIQEKPIKSFDIGKSCQRRIWGSSMHQPTNPKEPLIPVIYRPDEGPSIHRATKEHFVLTRRAPRKWPA